MLEALVSAAAALLGAAAGAIATYKAAGPYWERVKLSAEPALIEARLRLYGPLWDKTDYGTPEAPKDLSEEEKNKLLEDLRAWYYKDGAGLLLSDAARVQWSAVTDLLKRPPSPAGIGAGNRSMKDPWPEAIRHAMSCLRTRLKQDIHVHGPRIDESDCQDQPGWKVASRRRDSKS